MGGEMRNRALCVECAEKALFHFCRVCVIVCVGM